MSERTASIAIASLVVMLAAPRTGVAQCADGSIGRCESAPATVTIDPRRIAVLPFRTTGVGPDLEIGKGLADLITAEFNGEVGPTAVEIGEVLRAWKRAGGEREGLTQKQALQVARAVGAGQLVWGSVVGSGRTLTTTASILNSTDGTAKAAPIQVTGNQDSLPSLTNAIGTQLLGRVAGVTGAVSNEAVRAYVAGLTAYYGTKPQWAEQQFLAATKLDSTFVLPAYRLVVLRALFGPSQGVSAFRPAYDYLWRHRQLLGNDQRLLLQSLADSADLYFRAQALPRMERAIVGLPNSAEAWDILGNLYVHVGALAGRDNWDGLAKRAFLTAIGLDASLCLCANDGLAHLAYRDGDANAFEKYSGDSPWHRYLGALMKRDAARIRSARILYARELAVQSVGPSLGNGTLPPWLTGLLLPQPEVDSLLVILDALASDARQRTSIATWTMYAAHFAGQPARAAAAARSISARDSATYFANALELSDVDTTAAQRLLALADPRSQNACDVALWRLRRGDTAGVASVLRVIKPADQSVDRIVATLPARGQALPIICAHVLQGVMEIQQSTASALLLRADSLMRYMPRNCCDKWNHDLGFAFARRGEYAMAASAARRHAREIGTWPLPRLVTALRDEGRWAAAGGDTAAAIKAYKSYLAYRENPEPSMIPQRDSVRAELDSLDRPQRRRRTP
jgi:hypothetical protein